MSIQKQKEDALQWQALLAVGVWSMVGLATVSAQSPANTIRLGSGGNLQAALNQAQPGDEIRLAAGAVFQGNYVLPVKPGNGVITIRTDTPDPELPSADERIGPEHAWRMPTIRTPNALPALRTSPGTKHWRIMGVRFEGTGGADIVVLGNGTAAQDTYEEVPADIVLDRVIVRGDPVRGQKRGIALNSASTTVRNSHISEIKEVGQETQAIAGWNGPGPFLIENNYLEAAGINILFGGAEPHIDSLVPSDIVVRRNALSKPLHWRNEAWTVKNLFELKNARRVLVEGNIFEHNWAASQSGFAILFTVRNPGGTAPWSTVEDVTFQNNIVRSVSSGVNILGYDTSNPSGQARRIVIRNNLFQDVDHTRWGGTGTFLQIGDEPAEVTVEHNTVLQTGNIINAYGGTPTAPRPILGFRFANNIAFHNTYGISGDGYGTGTPAINAYFPGSVVAGNVLAGGQAQRYPDGNSFPSAADLIASFIDPAGADFRLHDGAFPGVTTDGTPPGVDHVELGRAMNGPAPTKVDSPTGLYASSVLGHTVTLRWGPQTGGPPPTSFVLQGGLNPGEELVSVPTGSANPIFTFAAPTGSFYARLRAISGTAVSAASNEIRIHVDVPVPPSAPADLTGMVNGSTVALSWRNTFEGGAPARLLLDVTGAMTATLPLPRAESFAFAGVPPGAYTLRLRAANAAGASAPSNAVTLTFPGACSGVPQAPNTVLAYRVGNTGYVTWDPPTTGPAPTGYIVNVGGTFAGSFAVSGRIVSSPIGPGTYNISVLGTNACGVGPPAPTAVMSVP
jgi:hypothetical protein